MNGEDRCLVCELTPSGRAAIATIAVCGREALAIVAQFFVAASGGALATFPLQRIVFGRWRSSANDAGEELCVCRTAPDGLEIHCHGGRAATGAILTALQAAGAEVVSQEDWLQRFTTDPHVATALALLREARTTRTAAILLDQARGAYSRAVNDLRRELHSGDSAAASLRIQRLLDLAPVGLHLTQPLRVVLAGAPNVGKSSLINKLVGYQRSIVFDLPGTTRDVIAATTAFDGWWVELRDTAGVRDTTDPLEAEGSRRALLQIEQADLVIWVRDATSASWSGDHELLRTSGVLKIWNKCDLASPPAADGFLVSAQTGAGLDRLQSAIVQQLCPHLPEPGEAVPVTSAQVSSLRRVQDALLAGDWILAQAASGEL